MIPPTNMPTGAYRAGQNPAQGRSFLPTKGQGFGVGGTPPAFQNAGNPGNPDNNSWKAPNFGANAFVAPSVGGGNQGTQPNGGGAQTATFPNNPQFDLPPVIPSQAPSSGPPPMGGIAPSPDAYNGMMNPQGVPPSAPSFEPTMQPQDNQQVGDMQPANPQQLPQLSFNPNVAYGGQFMPNGMTTQPVKNGMAPSPEALAFIRQLMGSNPQHIM